MAALILCLGDQLTATLPMLAAAGPEDTIVLVEVQEEATYVPHHPKKIAFLFSAMRHFAAALTAAGKQVRYVKLDDPANTGSFDGEVRRAVAALHPQRVVVTEPGEWRVLEKFRRWQDELEVPLEILPDPRFFATREDFTRHAQGRKQLRMEFFYRELRQRTGLLMAGDQPLGGRWNFDEDNRSAYDGAVPVPAVPHHAPDAITQEVLRLVAARFGHHFGTLEGFGFGVTRAAAQADLADFVQHRLPYFGRYQDAMVRTEPFLFHGLISFYLNCGLLEPREVCAAAEQAYHDGLAPLAAVEGFIRQILGWREYVRGVYWHLMPEYAARNRLNATRPLPGWFWTAETQMACLRQALRDTRDHAYAHHIQRLMVIGNFALLAGLDVGEVAEWFLCVYADAYEWVELPNVLGMALHGDGGVMGSKPYAASGAYIDRMGDACKGCRYNVKAKEGADACPFNRLYWDFLLRHEDVLGGNMRLKFPYATLRKFDGEKRARLQQEAAAVLAQLETL